MNRILILSALVAAVVAPWHSLRADEGDEMTTERSVSWRYDAIGRLVANGSGNDSKAPPYLLVDKHGEPRCYITPDDGLDLSKLVNRRVGVRGSVRAIDGDPMPHIVARGARPVGEPGQVAREENSGVVAASHVEQAGYGEELPTPQPDPSFSGSPEMVDGIMQDAPGQEFYSGPQPSMDVAGGCQGNCGHVGCSGPSCSSCAMCCAANDPGMWWVRAEWLLWDTKGMYVPPLVTTSPNGTARENAGVLGEPGTTILFGDETINGGTRSGGRIQFGRWLDDCQTWGLSGEYFGLQDETTSYSATSPGSPILARPFFDALNGQETSELVAFPNILSGTVAVDATTSFQGAGALLRYNICCKNVCWRDCNWCDPCNTCGGVPGGVRVGVLGGYRFMNLRDNLAITEDLTSLETANPGAFLIEDRFNTNNKFNGAEIGFVVEARKARWTVEFMTKLAIGSTRQTVDISGATAITEGGETELFTGGLLAQRTNIGSYSRSQFSMIPQINANLGYNLTPRLRVIAGYTLIYWSRVVRPGDQIDLDVNPNLLPPEANPFSGPLRPAFAWRDTDFWAQGLNLGLDYRF